MNWRALGCGLLAAALFVAVGVFGIWRSFAPPECPGSLPYEPASYQKVGAPTDEPRLAGVDTPLEAAGSASFGLASWNVWVDPGSVPDADEPLPARIVLECGTGDFQEYERGTP